MPKMTRRRALRGLALACHPLPTLAVTAISAGLAALAGLPLATGVILVAGRVHRAAVDRLVERPHRRRARPGGSPHATNRSRPARCRWPVVTAAIACRPGRRRSCCRCSLGYRAGLVALLTVACGWAYNLGLKATVLVVAAVRGRVRAAAGDRDAGPVRRAGRRPGRSRPGRCSGSPRTSRTCCPTWRADDGDRGAGPAAPARRAGQRGHRAGAAGRGDARSSCCAGATRLGGWRWVVVGRVRARRGRSRSAVGRARPSSRVFFVGDRADRRWPTWRYSACPAAG